MAPRHPPRRLRRWTATAVVTLSIVALAYGFHRLRSPALANLPTAAARAEEFRVTVKTQATLVATRSEELHAPNVLNLQITWLAPPGSTVKVGDPVIRFDPSSAQKDADAKTAALRQAQASLDQANAAAQIADQQDALDLATDQNGVASARLDASKAAILSTIDGDEAKLALGMAEEKLKVEQANINLHRTSNGAKIASATRNRDKAQADLTLDQEEMKQMLVRAPFNGVVTYLTNQSQGWMNAQPFKVGDHVWANAAIAEIPDLSSLEAQGKLAEIDRGQVSLGDSVEVHLDSLPEASVSGTLVNVAALSEPYYDGNFPPAKVFNIFARLNALDPRLRPQMSGSCNIVVRRIPLAIVVPARSLFTVAGKPVVYLQTPDGFQARSVQVLARNPDEAAVSGITAGARLALLDPTLKKAPGNKP
ncbi:MAG TPA: HlyD family efflux transporter periplasmic adaptor subunit [Terriglobales bacterium]|nr:HlyD family efflux transporter periplasmic adaptor subunit [Terriglobales bacterium]